jgi:hypothetical protein
MKQRIESKLANNRSIFIAGVDTKTLATPRVRPAVVAVLPTFQDLNTSNDLARVFGMKCQTNAGALFASTGREATVKMRLKWVKKR